MSELSTALTRYTRKNSKSYDAEFDSEIRRVRPDWFIDTMTKKKENLILMALRGDPKPISNKHPLGEFLSRYTNERHKNFDQDFKNIIEKIRPDWVINQTERSKEKKTILLQLALKGKPKPKQGSTLGNLLTRYIYKNGDCYDPIFDSKIREINPNWFITPSDNAKKIKEVLLDMAKKGCTKPIQKKDYLGTELSRYVSKSSGSFDSNFRSKLKRVRPDWLKTVSESSKNKKIKLLNIAESGKNKPSRGDTLNSAFYNYTQKNSDTYDPEFDRKIRKLRPDWFR